MLLCVKYECLWGGLTHLFCFYTSPTPTNPLCSPSPMSPLFSRRFSACWWVYCSLTSRKKNTISNKFATLRHHYSLSTFCFLEQHSGGRGATRGAHGAGLLGPHQDSAAQPRGGGQLLRRGHPRTFDVTRGGSLDAQPWSSVLTAGAAGRSQQNYSQHTRVNTVHSSSEKLVWVVCICVSPAWCHYEVAPTWVWNGGLQVRCDFAMVINQKNNCSSFSYII